MTDSADISFFTHRWPVLYEDNHLLGLYKPAGLLVQGDRTGDLSLLDLGKSSLKIRYDKPGQVFLGLVHRLDRPVAGAVLFARTSKAARTPQRPVPGAPGHQGLPGRCPRPHGNRIRRTGPSSGARGRIQPRDRRRRRRCSGGAPHIPPDWHRRRLVAGGRFPSHRAPAPDPCSACRYRPPHPGGPALRGAGGAAQRPDRAVGAATGRDPSYEADPGVAARTDSRRLALAGERFCRDGKIPWTWREMETVMGT